MEHIVYGFGKRDEPIFKGTFSECYHFVEVNGLTAQYERGQIFIALKNKYDNTSELSC